MSIKDESLSAVDAVLQISQSSAYLCAGYTKKHTNMNKLLIVLLAVCLVSTQAFVKRDAPAGTNYLETLQKQLEEASKDIGDKLKETFDPEKMKKGFNEAITNMEAALAELKKKANEAPKA